jgi:hypothetical protein
MEVSCAAHRVSGQQRADFVQYLETYTIKDRYRRGAEGLHGLMSFAEGASSLKSFNDTYQVPETSPNGKSSTSIKDKRKLTTDTKSEPASTSNDSQSRPTSRSQPQGPSGRRGSISDLQESLLPATAKELFSRAADSM